MLLFSIGVRAQNIEDAWVYFTGKPQANTYLNNPLSMLSQRALDRRTRFQIPLDISDVPVDESYINQIAGSQAITYLGKSKWLNAVHIQGLETDIQNLGTLLFVDHIEYANKSLNPPLRPATDFTRNITPIQNRRTTYNYGAGANQINMMHGEEMHTHNYTGQGVLLAVIDAGFIDVSTASLFQHLFLDNQVVDVYNFLDKDTNVYQYSGHGSGVLSTIAANDDGQFVGTAPDVSVALYISEDVSQEMPIEETYWAEAAERADSLGVDVINTSLGYMTFDRPEYNYTMDDLNGQTAFITRAANAAVSKGINVVVSAGNSGLRPWYKIGFPADSPSVITVGAVDDARNKAGFSSTGPTADGRIKPDVMAQGEGTTVYWSGNIQQGNGTSFSSPIMAGMVACLVQANPNKTPAEIKQLLLSISDRYNLPDTDYGYGIPDFSLINFSEIKELNTYNRIYPNPIKDLLFVRSNHAENYTLYSVSGKVIMSGSVPPNQGIPVTGLATGIYFININQHTYKLIKQ